MSELMHGAPAEVQPLPPFREELRTLYGEMLAASRESADGKLPGELVERALKLDEHIAIARGDDGRPVRYYGPDEDRSMPFKAAQRVHNVAVAARNEDGTELADKTWKKVLAKAGIERDIQAEGDNAWLAEGYRRAYDSEVVASLPEDDQALLDKYSRQRQERIAEGFATTPDEAVELLQHIMNNYGASSPEGTAAVIKYNNLLDADVRREFVEAAEAERDIAALSDEDIARMSEADLEHFLIRNPHLTRRVLDRRDHGQALLDEAYKPAYEADEDERSAVMAAAEPADAAGGATATEESPRTDGAAAARPKPVIPNNWKLVASAPVAEATADDDEEERWRRMRAAFDRHAGEYDDPAETGAAGADDSAGAGEGRADREPTSTGEDRTDIPATPPRAAGNPDFKSRLREMFASQDSGRNEALQDTTPEQRRRRRAVGAVLAVAALAGVGYLAYRLGTTPEHVLPPGFAHAPVPGSTGGIGGNGGNIARQGVETLHANGNAWSASEDALKQRGVAHPTNAQIANEDYNVVGRNYFKTHRLGQFTASAWERVARHLPVGTKLRTR